MQVFGSYKVATFARDNCVPLTAPTAIVKTLFAYYCPAVFLPPPHLTIQMKSFSIDLNKTTAEHYKTANHRRDSNPQSPACSYAPHTSHTV